MAVTPTLITRTATPNKPPTSGSLQPGQLSIEMATPTRLWVGVPATLDPTLQKLLFDSTALSTALANYLPLVGGALSGPLTLAADPTAATEAATKAYVDAQVALPSGVVSFNTRVGAVTLTAADVSTVTGLLTTGGAMTGTLTLAADPVAVLEAAPKQYVDSKIAAIPPIDLTPYLKTAGGVMTGALTLAADPLTVLDAATKQYVDNKIAGSVTSFNTRTGAITLAAGDVSTATGLLTTGGVMTGVLTLAADAVLPLEPVTLQQMTAGKFVDAPVDTFSYGRKDAAWERVLPLTGGVLTGALTIDPAASIVGTQNLNISAGLSAAGTYGANCVLNGGAAAVGSANYGGTVQIRGGLPDGIGRGGAVSIAGSGSAGGTGGGVSLAGGTGSGAGTTGGDIQLSPGQGLVGGVDGDVEIVLWPTSTFILRTLPTVATADPNGVWNNAGVLNIGAGGAGGLADAPVDTFFYGRKDATWVQGLPLTGGVVTGSTTFTKSLVLTPTFGPAITAPAVTVGQGQIIQIIAGSSTDPAGVGGNVALNGGDGTAKGGNIYIAPGGGGTPGLIRLGMLPNVAQTTTDAIWDNNGVLNIGAGGTSGIVDAPSDTFFYGRKDATWVQGLPLTGGVVTGDITLSLSGRITSQRGSDVVGTIPSLQIRSGDNDSADNRNGGPLIFSAGRGGSTGGNGGVVTITAGASTVNLGGALFLTSGEGASLGGPISITAGAATAGGQISIAAGIGQVVGGATTVSGGASPTNKGGPATVVGGAGQIGGNVTISGGAGDPGFGGDLTLNGGTGATKGGQVRILAGDGGTLDGGGLVVAGGNAPGAAVGGGVSIRGGYGNAGAHNGATVTVSGGTLTEEGYVEMLGGYSSVGNAGEARVIGGTSAFATGKAGNSIIRGGRSNVTLPGATPGDVIISGGDSAIVGLFGNVIIENLPTVAPADPIADPDVVWNNAGVLNIGAGGAAGGAFLPLSGGTVTGAVTADVPNNWSSYAMGLIVGSPTNAHPGIMFLNDSTTTPAFVFDRWGDSFYLSVGTTTAWEADLLTISRTGTTIYTGLNVNPLATTVGPGLNILLKASDTKAAGPAGGSVQITAGNATDGIGGFITIDGGRSTTGRGGSVEIQAGTSAAGNGDIVLLNLPTAAPGGASAVWNNAGVLNIGAGGAAGGGMAEPVGAGAWGRLETAAWAPVLPLLGGTLMGPLRVEAGFTVAPQDSTLAGANVSINAGDGNLLGGYLDLTAGDSVSADGGDVTIGGGATAGAASTAGTVFINAGRNTNPVSTVAGAGVTINGGVSQLGIGGEVLITAGTSELAGGGSLRLLGGTSNGAGQNGGNVNIGGGSSGGGAPGNIIMSSLPTVAPAISGAIWRDPVTNALYAVP